MDAVVYDSLFYILSPDESTAIMWKVVFFQKKNSREMKKKFNNRERLAAKLINFYKSKECLRVEDSNWVPKKSMRFRLLWKRLKGT